MPSKTILWSSLILDEDYPIDLDWVNAPLLGWNPLTPLVWIIKFDEIVCAEFLFFLKLGSPIDWFDAYWFDGGDWWVVATWVIFWFEVEFIWMGFYFLEGGVYLVLVNALLSSKNLASLRLEIFWLGFLF